MIRMVATDLDGTLLRDDKTVSAWTRSVLDALVELGVYVVPVTARQPMGLAPIAAACGLDGWAICVNGALAQHLGTGEVAFEHLVDVPAVRTLVQAVREQLPGTVFAVVRDRGATFGMEPGYREVSAPSDHQPARQHARDMDVDEICAEPALKLLARNPAMTALELSALLSPLAQGGVHVTTSGADFVEMAAGGVTKATGLDELCAHLGVDQSEVVAFGDAPNDVEMLAWAGHSWAVANAVDQVKEVARNLTTSNMDDGVGRALMGVLREQGVW